MRANQLKYKLYGVFSLLFIALAGLPLWLSHYYSQALQDMSATFTLEKAAYLYAQPLEGKQVDLSPFHISSTTVSPYSDSLLPLKHNDAIYRFQDANNTLNYALKVANKHDSLWLTFNASKALPISQFNGVLYTLFLLIVVLIFIVSFYTLRLFSHLYAQLELAWEKEKTFVTDVSHELRTPISIIKNTLTLSQQRALSEHDHALLKQTTQSLQDTIDNLLALARDKTLANTSLCIIATIEEAVMALYKSETILQEGNIQFDIRLDTPEQLVVNGNPKLIELLIQNIINNAFYHAPNSPLHIEYHEGVLTFSNPLKDKNIASSYQGLGHGQFLLKRIANALSWTIQFDSEGEKYSVRIEGF